MLASRASIWLRDNFWRRTHVMLLVLAAPCQLCRWAGQEHGETIPLADMRLPITECQFPFDLSFEIRQWIARRRSLERSVF